jgi:hypothetical protein
MDDDDEIFNTVSTPAQDARIKKENSAELMDSGLGGFSFETNPSHHNPPPQNSGDFGLMGLDFGGGSTSNQAQPSSGQQNTGFGGDLFGFGGSSTASQPPQHQQPPPNNQFGGDLMGFGFDAPPPSQPPPQQTTPPQSPGLGGGFSFDSSPAQSPTYQQPKPPAPQPQNNNFGFDILGGDQSAPQANKPPSSQVTSGFQPITNTNPNKVLAYENQHVQIWMDCIKESHDTTKLFTTYINKTNNTLTNLTIQAAVVKHVKLTINPLNSTTLQPYSKEVVHQVFYLLI